MLNRGIFCLLRRKFYNEWPKYVLSLIRNVRPSNLLAAAGSFLGLHRLQRGRGKEISFPPPAVAYYVIGVRQGRFSEALVGRTGNSSTSEGETLLIRHSFILI